MNMLRSWYLRIKHEYSENCKRLLKIWKRFATGLLRICNRFARYAKDIQKIYKIFKIFTDLQNIDNRFTKYLQDLQDYLANIDNRFANNYKICKRLRRK